MSHEIEGIKITDSRINDLTNDLTFGVFDGKQIAVVYPKDRQVVDFKFTARLPNCGDPLKAYNTKLQQKYYNGYS